MVKTIGACAIIAFMLIIDHCRKKKSNENDNCESAGIE